MTSEDLQYKTIDFLRFPIIIGVVFVHSFGPHFDIGSIDYSHLSGVDFYNIFRVLLSKLIGTIASPYFFFVSGFLYFLHIETLNKSTYISKTQNRIKTLLIPYIVWNLLAFLIPILTTLMKGDMDLAISMLKEFNLNYFWAYKKWEFTINENFFGHYMYKTAPLNTPLWFLRDLFVLSVLSPLVFLFVRKTKLVGVIVLGLCFLTRTWVSTPGFGIVSIFFFSLGAYFGINKLNIIEEIGKIKWISAIIFILTLGLNVYFWGEKFQVIFLFSLFKIAGLFTTIIITAHYIKKGVISSNNLLARSSFFIYVAHSITILGVTNKAFTYLFQTTSPFLLTIKYLAIPLTASAICLGLYVLLKKYFSPIFDPIMGSR